MSAWISGAEPYKDYSSVIQSWHFGSDFGGTDVESVSSGVRFDTPTSRDGSMYLDNLWAIQSGTVTAATINQLRMAFQIQKLYEKDARGGTRYIEILKSHFGVTETDDWLKGHE